MMKNSLSEAKRQIQIQKKLIKTYEGLSKNGHKCKFCKKMFISIEFLSQHYKKKHPNEVLEKEPERKTDIKEIQSSIGKYVNNILDNSVKKLEQMISENQKIDDNRKEENKNENEKIIEKVVEKTILMVK